MGDNRCVNCLADKSTKNGYIVDLFGTLMVESDGDMIAQIAIS